MKQLPEQGKDASLSTQPSSSNADDITNGSSSIIEFLNQEQKCLISNENDVASELDIDSIFEEINRLSDESDERSVDEILREAELLMSKQQQIESNLNRSELDNENDIDDTADLNGLGERTNVYNTWHLNEHLETISEKTTPQNTTKSQSSDSRDEATLHTIDDLESDGQGDRVRTSRTKIATPTKNTNQKRKNEPVLPMTAPLTTTITPPPIAVSQNAIDESVLELEIPNKKSPESMFNVNDYENNNNNNNVNDSIKNCLKIEANVYHDENGAMSLPILSKPRSSRSPSVATLASPTTPITSAMSTSSSFSGHVWTRERALEQQIESLRETLKDTEERLHSLRLQYDNVSQMHRSMRDKNHQIQDEMDRLKIDAQHLHECANILRTELQSARKDRADALELQAMLQRELDTAREEKRRATDEVESNGRQIMDLQRQCKEMERILARKNPDAMQMLLGVGSKKAEDQAQMSAGRRQLEQRIAQLESDAKEQDRKAQLILANVQSRFSSVQSKYETHISDLETQVLSLQQINQILHEKIESQARHKSSNNNYMIDQQSCGTQTLSLVDKKSCMTSSVHTQTEPKSPAVSPAPKPVPTKKSTKQTISTKEETHLLATVRGMRVDLAIKEKALQRLTRELDECKKTIKKLQKENESNRVDKTTKKPYDPAQFTEKTSPSNVQLQEKIKLLEIDYKTLHDKRLNDLKILQSAHERELSANKETVRLLEQRLAERDEAFAIIQKHNKIPIDYFALKQKFTKSQLAYHFETRDKCSLCQDHIF
ncbi:putative uncharacterized protein DDB_G0271606 isoform X2 [Contarinia nasturtii]|uniref:putative uncharacterized protein DDB_G0271606 isoform X2 n=1 Tax=Contarinia nasturtii TaxID=265458 RepID=UPI0012D3E6DE|nr:putative uncharacterized protein DDB_G0271606 isoform X2 [Contarinia nasturtii]